MKIEVLRWSSDRTFEALLSFEGYSKNYFTAVPYSTKSEITVKTIEEVLTSLNFRTISYVKPVRIVNKKGQRTWSDAKFTVWVIKD